MLEVCEEFLAFGVAGVFVGSLGVLWAVVCSRGRICGGLYYCRALMVYLSSFAGVFSKFG